MSNINEEITAPIIDWPARFRLIGAMQGCIIFPTHLFGVGEWQRRGKRTGSGRVRCGEINHKAAGIHSHGLSRGRTPANKIS